MEEVRGGGGGGGTEVVHPHHTTFLYRYIIIINTYLTLQWPLQTFSKDTKIKDF